MVVPVLEVAFVGSCFAVFVFFISVVTYLSTLPSLSFIYFSKGSKVFLRTSSVSFVLSLTEGSVKFKSCSKSKLYNDI
jgi:hypothetical protein